eukprot:IDg1847t1
MLHTVHPTTAPSTSFHVHSSTYRCYQRRCRRYLTWLSARAARVACAAPVALVVTFLHNASARRARTQCCTRYCAHRRMHRAHPAHSRARRSLADFPTITFHRSRLCLPRCTMRTGGKRVSPPSREHCASRGALACTRTCERTQDHRAYVGALPPSEP